MEFQVKRIGEETPRTPWGWLVRWMGRGKALLVAGILLLVVGVATAQVVVTRVLPDAGGVLPTRSFWSNPLEHTADGVTNLLILGNAGWGEEGALLTDSIIVASIDPKVPSVTMLSLPRDLWMAESPLGAWKLNSIFSRGYSRYGEDRGLEIVKETVGGYLGTEVHYAAMVNFDLFTEMIDELGGVDIYVTQDIYDTQYPAANYQYQTFYVQRGQQTMDGDTALKYARSRQTTSDFDRARRQQDLIKAIKAKAEALGILGNAAKLKNYYGLYRENVTSDLTMFEISNLAKLALRIDREQINHLVLSNNVADPGGILWTPDPGWYGGQFVLAAVSDDQLADLVNLQLGHPQVTLEKAQVTVLNASDREGVARRNANYLNQIGIRIDEVDSWPQQLPAPEGIGIWVKDSELYGETAAYLAELYDGEVIEKADWGDLNTQTKDQQGNTVNTPLAQYSDLILVLNPLKNTTTKSAPAKTAPKRVAPSASD